jgi:hypothetical protein
MNDENPYESPKTANTVSPRNTGRIIQILSGLAGLLVSIGASLATLSVFFPFWQISNNEHSIFGLMVNNASGALYIGFDLIVLGIILAGICVVIWCIGHKTNNSLKDELQQIVDAKRNSTNLHDK